MGGRGPKAPPITCADLCSLCAECNVRAEADLQREAIAYGWKIPRSTFVSASEAPIYDKVTANWWLLDAVGGRKRITLVQALELQRRYLGD